MIHPTAIVHPQAKLAATVRVGPFAVIDEGVELGAHCQVGPHAYLTGLTTAGSRNQFYSGCVIGDAPQDLKYDGTPTRLRIGDGNVFREYCTAHRSSQRDGETVIGSNNLFMACSHIAHNCAVGNHVTLANGALLAGHAVVQDRAFISGNCLVHQFTRIGTLAMMQGGCAISKDLPPFMVAVGVNEICGLNLVGLRRAGWDAVQRLELKRLYHALFRSGKKFRAALESAQGEFDSVAARVLLEFCREAKRGVCTDVGDRRAGDEDG